MDGILRDTQLGCTGSSARDTRGQLRYSTSYGKNQPNTHHHPRTALAGLTQWRLQMAKRLQMEVKQLREATSKAHDSEVPRAATAQPQEPQPTHQTGEKTTDGGSTTLEVPHAAMVLPQTTPMSTRPGSPSCSQVVAHMQGLDKTTTTCARPGSPSRSHAVTHTQGINELPAAIQKVSNATADTANPYATCAGPTRPADRSEIPPGMPLKERTGDEVKSGEMVNEECHMHERVNNVTSQVETSEDKTTTTVTPDASPRTPLKGESTHRQVTAVSS